MDDTKTAGDGPDTPQPHAGPPVYDVATLVKGGREAVILHEGQRYRLTITANRKLILTK